MVFIRNLILYGFLIGLSLQPSIAIEDDSEENCPILPMKSLQEVEDKVTHLLKTKKDLKPKNICVVFDFHGVIVNEKEHQEKLSLKEGSVKMLQYLKDKDVSFLLTSAWIPFRDVIKGVVDLKLQDFFSVDPDHIAELKDFELGQKKKKFKGYKNGMVAALKYADSDSEADPYFRQKAHTIELCYLETEIKYILFVDDSKNNIEQFREDAGHIPHTANVNFEGLFLYHLRNPFSYKRSAREEKRNSCAL